MTERFLIIKTKDGHCLPSEGYFDSADDAIARAGEIITAGDVHGVTVSGDRGAVALEWSVTRPKTWIWVDDETGEILARVASDGARHTGSKGLCGVYVNHTSGTFVSADRRDASPFQGRVTDRLFDPFESEWTAFVARQ